MKYTADNIIFGVAGAMFLVLTIVAIKEYRTWKDLKENKEYNEQRKIHDGV